MPYLEKILTLCDVEEILALQQEVIKTLERPETFHPDTREETEIFLTGAFGVGIYNKDKMIAYQIMHKPSYSNSLLRHLPEYVPKNLGVIHSETNVVHPDYRGKGLQKRLKETSLQIIKKHNYADIVCNTIHPLNYPSLKNSLRMGFMIVRIKEFYGGKPRCVLVKPINDSLLITYHKDVMEVPLNKYTEISRILETGYIGHTFYQESVLLSRIISSISKGTGNLNHPSSGITCVSGFQ